MGRYIAREGFVPGGHAKITGDSRFGHDRPKGTLVELRNYDDADDTWEVREAEGTNTWTFWSNANELKLVDIEPTPEEVAALFGIPKPCTMCGCPTNGKH